MLTAVVLCGCNRESARQPDASGSSDGYGTTSRSPRKNVPAGVIVETPITTTSRIVFGGHEWKRDPAGSTVGSEDLPEMRDDGIEDSFTAYLTDDPERRLFCMLTGEGQARYGPPRLGCLSES